MKGNGQMAERKKTTREIALEKARAKSGTADVKFDALDGFAYFTTLVMFANPFGLAVSLFAIGGFGLALSSGAASAGNPGALALVAFFGAYFFALFRVNAKKKASANRAAEEAERDE